LFSFQRTLLVVLCCFSNPATFIYVTRFEFHCQHLFLFLFEISSS
jgi:hypothetical protein